MVRKRYMPITVQDSKDHIELGTFHFEFPQR